MGEATKNVRCWGRGEQKESWGDATRSPVFPGRKPSICCNKGKWRAEAPDSMEAEGRAAQGHTRGKQQVLRRDPPKAGKDILWAPNQCHRLCPAELRSFRVRVGGPQGPRQRRCCVSPSAASLSSWATA